MEYSNTSNLNRNNYAAVVEAANNGQVEVLPLLIKYKNPIDRERISKLLQADFEENKRLTYDSREILEEMGQTRL